MSVELAGGGSYFGIIGVTLGEEPRSCCRATGGHPLGGDCRGVGSYFRANLVTLGVESRGVIALVSE